MKKETSNLVCTRRQIKKQEHDCLNAMQRCKLVAYETNADYPSTLFSANQDIDNNNKTLP